MPLEQRYQRLGDGRCVRTAALSRPGSAGCCCSCNSCQAIRIRKALHSLACGRVTLGRRQDGQPGAQCHLMMTQITEAGQALLPAHQDCYPHACTADNTAGAEHEYEHGRPV